MSVDDPKPENTAEIEHRTTELRTLGLLAARANAARRASAALRSAGAAEDRPASTQRLASGR